MAGQTVEGNSKSRRFREGTPLLAGENLPYPFTTFPQGPEKRVCHEPHIFQFFNPRILSDGKPDEKREMMGNLKEDDIQKYV